MPTWNITVAVGDVPAISAAYNGLRGAELEKAVRDDLIAYLKLRVRKAQEETAAAAARAAVRDISVS